MIEFDKNKNALEDSLKDCDRRNLIDLSSQFSDSVNHYLMIADDSLRRVVKKINDLNAGFWREGHR